MKIAVIDYGIGNVRSIINAFKKIGVEPILTNDKKILLEADGVVLPGVGAFGHGMQNLNELSLVETIHQYVDSKKPFLGICLGMQMLMDTSEEFGTTKGLGLIGGSVIKMDVNQNDKLPHIGWNSIEKKNTEWENSILDSMQDGEDMYFVHSYVASPDDEQNILSTTQYCGYEFCSSVKKGNIYGCQFHPEKSAEAGLKILENFINICEGLR